MRIVLDLQACQASSMHRGIGRYSMALALAMARNSGGHELRIVLNEDYPDGVAAVRKAFDGLLPQSHIGTFMVPLPTAEADPRNAWRMRAAERVREHYLASLRPDMVHVASLFEGLGDNSVVSVPHREERFDTAVTLYDLIPLMRKERYLNDPSMAAWYYRKLEGMKKAGLLLAISESARQEGVALLQLPPERVVNISSAVDAIFRPRTFTPDARAALLARHGVKRDFIMYTGGIDYRKNIEGLLEAYAMLPASQRRQYQLAVVCSIRDPDRIRLERLAAKFGLAKDDLVLTGFVSDDDLVSLYNCTALFVFPSLHEGFGLPALEAMACGAPVIGSNTSSIPEVIGRRDAMFDPTSVEAISAAMAQVLLDPARQAALREHGLAQATRFSWDASAQRAIEAFEEAYRRRDATSVSAAQPPPPVRKPRLAWVSPQPPTPQDIAACSAGLLPELAQHYDIDLVQDQAGVDDPALRARFPHRSIEWFDANAHTFDHIVYQLGNSACQPPMSALLERHPGVVVLHDHAGAESPLPNHDWYALYLAHGYGALLEEKQDRAASVLTFPCNKAVLERACGVIVHSAHVIALANRLYGPGFAADWRVVRSEPGFEHAHAAALYRDAFDHFARAGQGKAEASLIASIAALGDGVPEPDLLQTAQAIAANRPRRGLRQVLVDIDAGMPDDALLGAIIAQAPDGWRIEPVRHDGTRYRYARRTTLDLIGRTDLQMEDAVVDAKPGDVLLAIGETAPALVPPAWLARGVLACGLDVPSSALSAGRIAQRLAALLDGAAT